MSPLVSPSMAQASCPKAAQECLGCPQSLLCLELAVGSPHVSEIKYNAKFFQVHDVCFPGILSLLSALNADFLEVKLVHREGVSSRVGMAVAVLELTCCCLLGTGDIRVPPSQQGCLCRGRQLLTKWPTLFPTLACWFTCSYSLTLIFPPTQSFLDLVLYLLLYLSRFGLILEKGGWRPHVWILFHGLRPYLLNLLLLLSPFFAT